MLAQTAFSKMAITPTKEIPNYIPFEELQTNGYNST